MSDAPRVAIVLGTRPEIIKMSPLVRECQRRGVDFFLLHTGQHYSHAMDGVFFEDLELPAPRHNLSVGSGTHGAQTGRMMAGIEEVLLKERPSVVLVQGDTNTVAAAALCAAKLRIPVGHVEAGLRSFDRSMPEEVNRVVADHVSDHLFAPTEGSAANLRREGLPETRIHVTGNTVVDAVLQNRDVASRRRDALDELGLREREYLLLTAHRQENVDDPARFGAILESARRVSRRFGLRVLYPIHPRSRKMLGELGLDASGLDLVEPLDYLRFLQAQEKARLILTDSGGVQEEACVLGVPCVTLRDNTERPETIEVGANALAGVDPARVLAAAEEMMARPATWRNPFGDGRAAARILDVLGAR